ncbi:GNAT family N-acetyltransferase, partial [Mesorhizobium sp. M8A.F.Ca.ET.207.01.1.1]|uniref:GNAT family N-acetyltransferase n=1 Tax=Mesorhizobium sp. M8A.F.Ca.ET.207.01.1.1 TaxID=2563968 RepID=UPI001AEEF1B8
GHQAGELRPDQRLACQPGPGDLPVRGYQGQGIGHALFEAVLPHLRTPVLTVRASLNAVPTYLRYGFVLDGDVGEFNGLVYQQMVRAAA